MARIQTYPNDIFVTGNDKWIGSDANNDFITKNFTANAVAEYFNRVGIIDTGSFNWSYRMYAPTETQPAKTFELVDHPFDTVDVIGLAGTIKVSFLTMANTEPGVFIEEVWNDKIILVNRPGFPSEYGLYKVTAVVEDGDYYFLDLDFIGGNSGTISEDEPVTFGLFTGVSGTSGTTGTSGTSGTTGTSGTSGVNGTSGSSGTTGTSGSSGTAGTSGSSGTTGTSGSSGTGGTSGTSGTNGSAGSSGRTGTSGTSGIDGIDGTDGTNGTSGTDGTGGTSGTNGSAGTSGTSGTDGSGGTSGIDGTSGTGGTSGTSGTDGTSGTGGTSGTDGTGGTSGTNGTGGSSGTSGTAGTSGTTGTSGTAGTSGTGGTSGENGVSNNLFLYKAHTTTQTGYPGNGNILWNNTTQINSTQINISHLTDNGIDIDIFLALLKDSQQITIQDRNSSANYQVWDVNGTPTQVTGANNYWIVPVILISSAGTGSTNFANNHPLFLAIVSQSGTSGINGTSGTSGTTGTSGSSGSSGTTPVNQVTGTGVAGQVAYFNGTNSITSNAAFAFTPTSQLLVNNSVTAASAIARGTNLTPTLTAAANNDVLVGLDINPTFTNGAFTGVQNTALRVAGSTIIGAENGLRILGSGFNNNTGGFIYSGGIGGGDLYLSANVDPLGTIINSGNFSSRIRLRGSEFSASFSVVTGSTSFPALFDFFPNVAQTSGARYGASWTSYFQPTSGNASYSAINIRPVINTTGTYSGTVVGILYNPTLTSLTGATHRAIETVTGDVAIGTTSGSLLVGTTTNAGFRLDVNGTARVSGSITISGNNVIKSSNNTEQIYTYGGSLFSNGSFFGVNGNNVTENRQKGAIEFYSDISNASSDAGSISFGTHNAGSSFTWRMIIFKTGNLLLTNSGVSTSLPTDAGFKLDVNGTARFQTSMESPIWNWSGTNVSQRIRVTQLGSVNNALINIENGQGDLNYSTSATTRSILAINNNRIILQNQGLLSLLHFNPTYDFNANVTSGAIIRGIFYNPTISTIQTATHRAFENTTGDVLLCTTSGNVAIGTSTLATATELTLGGSQTASSAIARGGLINTTLVAAANNDVLVGLDINPTFTNGAFTGVSNIALRVRGNSAFNSQNTITVPSPLFANNTFLFVGNGALITASNRTIDNDLYLSSNFYYNGTNSIYRTQSAGATIGLDATGGVLIQTAVSGTAGAIATPIQRLYLFNSTGNLLLQSGGTFTDAGFRLDVNGTARVQNNIQANNGIYITAGTLRVQSLNGAGDAFIFTDDNGTQLRNQNWRYSRVSTNVWIGGGSDEATSLFTMNSTTKGFLPPRMTSAQRTAIASPATGLIVYQTDGVEGLWLRVSTGWVELTVV
jgi:hypothetical protein